MAIRTLCDGVKRRDFLKAGVLGGAGLSLENFLRLSKAGEVRPAKATSAIFMMLTGGPSHLDTFDMKPDGASENRGEFKPISTNVPGIEISELLPKLSQCADKFALLRGVSHTQAAHPLGIQYLCTGNQPVPSLQFPGYGAVVSKELPGPSDLPGFVAIPSTPESAGYLGVQYAPLQTNSTPKVGKPYSVRGLSLANGLTVTDVHKRTQLLHDLDTKFDRIEKSNDLVRGLNEFAQQAHDIVGSPRSREAFDISREPRAVAESFGETAFGQSCLLATRLVEAGVRFVTVTYGGWDTHSNNFKTLKGGQVGALDAGLAALFTTLSERGLLDSTAVYVTGEFGRTPKINPRSGRDHWPRAMFSILAGGGIRGGQVYGASDKNGMGPDAEAITPDHVAATFYHCLGIDSTKEYHTSSGRPVMILREGTVLEKLF
ncbi:MAG: DUF1501 domain-containing protein [Planctomycetota bacterium]|nr:DUF1501 domain-containing protein [Planctomycetota bacterium]